MFFLIIGTCMYFIYRNNTQEDFHKIHNCGKSILPHHYFAMYLVHLLNIQEQRKRFLKHYLIFSINKSLESRHITRIPDPGAIKLTILEDAFLLIITMYLDRRLYTQEHRRLFFIRFYKIASILMVLAPTPGDINSQFLLLLFIHAWQIWLKLVQYFRR